MSSDLGPLPRWILAGWLAVLVILAVAFLADVSPEGGWGDLVLTVGLLLGVVGLAAIAVTWVLVRFVVGDRTLRAVVALVAPPLLTTVAIALVRFL
jgi:hypothetical protein